MKKYLFLLTSLLFLWFSHISFAAEEIVVCTMDAKLCPDGVTYVGRSGPNCEFDACPVSEKPKVCTKEYSPICAQTPALTCMSLDCQSHKKTYGNTCMMEAESATFLYEWTCKNEIPFNSDLISEKTKLRIDTTIETLTLKIDKKYTDATKKSLLVYKMIERLNQRKTESEKLKVVIQYIIQKLEAYSRSVQDQSSWGLPD